MHKLILCIGRMVNVRFGIMCVSIWNQLGVGGIEHVF